MTIEELSKQVAEFKTEVRQDLRWLRDKVIQIETTQGERNPNEIKPSSSITGDAANIIKWLTLIVGALVTGRLLL